MNSEILQTHDYQLDKALIVQAIAALLVAAVGLADVAVDLPAVDEGDAADTEEITKMR